MEHVRQAAPDDAERIVELATVGRAELLEQRGGILWDLRESRPDPERTLPAAIEDPDQRVVVGLLDDYVVGYASARLERLRDGSLLGVVDDVYVEPPFRELSVGELLLDDLWGWCRARGCRGIDSLALPGMRETKNFFERFGMKARALLVHASFEPADEDPAGEDGATDPAPTPGDGHS